MANPEQDDSGGEKKSESVVAAALAKFELAVILFRFWKLPIVPAAGPRPQPKDERATKVLALVVIFFLGLAVRNRSEDVNLLGSAAASLAAAILAAIIDRVSRAVAERASDGAAKDMHYPVILSAYVSMIVLMVAFVFADSVLAVEAVWYQQLATDRWTFAATVFGAVVTFLIWILKSVLWDRSRIGFRGIWHGLAVVAATGLVVYGLANIPPEFVCLAATCTEEAE